MAGDRQLTLRASNKTGTSASSAVPKAAAALVVAQRARENIPDLILLDMMLPKVSGLDVLRALKGDVLVKPHPRHRAERTWTS